MKKVLITDLKSSVSDGILRVLHAESDYHIYLFSDNVQTIIEKNRLTIFPTKLTDFKNVKNIVYQIKPDFIIFTYNYGNYYSDDKATIQRENFQTLENIVRITRVLDNHLIYISKEFVFNGKKGPYTEDDKPGTDNYYGSTIHSAENLALTSVNRCTVVRHSLIYGYKLYDYFDFTDMFINKLSRNNNFELNFNYYTNPVLLEEFAYSVQKILEKNLLGVYHISGSEYLTLEDYLYTVADFFRLDTSKIELKYKSKPLKFGLINLKAEANFGIKYSDIKNGLTAMKFYSYGDKLF